MENNEPAEEQTASEQSEKTSECIVSGASFRKHLMVFAFGERSGNGPAKRIVSKSEYAALVSKREAKRWGSVGLAVAVAVCILSTLGLVLAGLLADGMGWRALCFVAAVPVLSAAWIIKNLAEKSMLEASVALNVVPLTRANIGDLTVFESLVRASQEPVQAQQAELLRPAAQGGGESPAEELLRAATTREQN